MKLIEYLFDRITIGIASIALLVSLTECKSAQTSISDNEYMSAEKTVGHTPQQRFKEITTDAKEFSSISVGVKIELKKPTAFSFSGSAFFERDKSVFFSLRKFGFEVAQLYISNDSIIAVDKFNKIYLAESLKQLTAGIHVDINNIQDLFLGQIFYPGSKPTLDKFKFEEMAESESWAAYPKDMPKNVEAGFLLSLTDNLLKALAVGSGESTFKTVYGQFYPTPIGSFPLQEQIRFESAKFNADLLIGWSWTGAVFNDSSKQKNISIPKGCRRVEATALLKNLAN